MSQRNDGAWALLSAPAAYNFVQKMMGGDRARPRFVADFVRPTPGMRILDFGCGTGEILKYLPEDVHYVGYDPDPGYIAHAQEQFGTRAIFHDRLLLAEEAATLEKVDLAMAIGVLHHMSDVEVESFLRLVSTVMKPGARLLTLDGCYVKGQNLIARFLISQDRGKNVRTPEAYAALCKRVFGTSVSGVVEHRKWPPYTLWIMEMSLKRTAQEA